MEHWAMRWNIEQWDGTLGDEMEHWAEHWAMRWSIGRWDGALGDEMKHWAMRWSIGLWDGALGDEMEHWAMRWNIERWDGALGDEMEHWAMRWSIALQPYVFTVHHRKGAENSNADSLDDLWRRKGCDRSRSMVSGHWTLFLILEIVYFYSFSLL